jgi:hypothetical protein
MADQSVIYKEFRLTKRNRSRVQRFRVQRFMVTENPPAIRRTGGNPEPVNAYLVPERKLPFR